MFPFSNVLNLFAHELAGLGGRRFTLSSILVSALNRTFFRHTRLLPNKIKPLSAGRAIQTNAYEC